MYKFLVYLRTASKLGIKSCIYFGFYKILLKLGVYKLILKRKKLIAPIFTDTNSKEIKNWDHNATLNCILKSDQLLNGIFYFYKSSIFNMGNPPNWFFDPFTKTQLNNQDIHWVEFTKPKSIDIKNYWELSRWEWAPLLARAWRYTGKKDYLICLQDLVEDWCIYNPVNQGVNWICAQEASIRLIHALQAYKIVSENEFKISKEWKQFIKDHLERIYITQIYAVSQSNNHWISEAAALFIGGSLISDQRFSNVGRYSLEKAVKYLVMKDGSFAQHSTNYHRLVLDTLSQVEIWRRELKLKPFSNKFQESVKNLLNWLTCFVDPITGKAANLGSNDGAYCYGLHDLSFEDYRPSLQLASKLFWNKTFYENGIWDEPLFWYKLNKKNNKKIQLRNNKVQIFNQGGYAVLRPDFEMFALLRLPVYKFRPSQCDPLHFDLWYKGFNLLVDGGSYSYESNTEDIEYFSGIESHNTVQFDGFQPMPRLSKFLFGDWLKMESPLKYNESINKIILVASYKCRYGFHQRKIEFNKVKKCFKVTDQLSGFSQKAIIRWRLADLDWQRINNTFKSSKVNLIVENIENIKKLNFTNGFKSTEYCKKLKIPVLEIHTDEQDATIITNIQLID